MPQSTDRKSQFFIDTIRLYLAVSGGLIPMHEKQKLWFVDAVHPILSMMAKGSLQFSDIVIVWELTPDGWTVDLEILDIMSCLDGR